VVAPAETTAAEHAPAPDGVENTVAASYTAVDYETAHYALDYGAFGLSDHLWFPPGLEVAVGLRIGYASKLVDSYCLEGFGRLSVVPHFGLARDAKGRTASWRPALGVEIGGTTADRQFAVTPVGSGFRDGPTPKGMYAGIVARPLHFRFSSFDASSLGVTFATMLGSPGRDLRVQVELLQIGVAF
jgi:hypothetical protein